MVTMGFPDILCFALEWHQMVEKYHFDNKLCDLEWTVSVIRTIKVIVSFQIGRQFPRWPQSAVM